MISVALLAGLWDNAKATKRYFTKDEEAVARLAIGRLLRNEKPLDSLLRYQLAELFDHEPPHLSFDGAPMVRKIVFENRRAGQSAEVALRDLHLVSDYRTLIEAGMVHQRAVAQVCKKYDVSDTTVKDARRRNPSLNPRAVKKRISRPG